MPPDYKKGSIYKLVNDTLNLTYYGSTIQPLHKRLHAHKTASKKCSSEILFTEGICKIYLVEEYPCENKRQLEQRERYYIENNICVNKIIPFRTKDEIHEYQKQWGEENKEHIKQYREKNKEIIKEQLKKRYEKNKEYVLQNSKKRYEKNKEQIKQQFSEKINCECGSIIRRNEMSRHKKTKKHINYDVKNSS